MKYMKACDCEYIKNKYHNYARSKYNALGMPDRSPTKLPTDAEIHQAKSTINSISGFSVI